MFVPGETEQKNQNAQLLLPYNSEWINFSVVSVGYLLCIKASAQECLLPLFYGCDLFRYSTGPLAVIYLIKNERNCHVLMMPFSAFAFHHSKRHNTACQQKKAVEDESIVKKLCERRQKSRQYSSVQMALNSVMYLQLTFLGFVRGRIWAREKSQSALRPAWLFLRHWSWKGSVPVNSVVTVESVKQQGKQDGRSIFMKLNCLWKHAML